MTEEIRKPFKKSFYGKNILVGMPGFLVTGNIKK